VNASALQEQSQHLIEGMRVLYEQIRAYAQALDLPPGSMDIRPKPSTEFALLALSPIRRVNPKLEVLQKRAVESVLSGTPWLTAAEVGTRVNPGATNKHALASRWLGEGKIFAIQRAGQNEYPSYAFEETGYPIPALAEVLDILEGMSPFRIAAWFESRTSTLNGKRPRELLASNARAVIEAAKSHREEAVHG
jgi:hypothetical protein